LFPKKISSSVREARYLQARPAVHARHSAPNGDLPIVRNAPRFLNRAKGLNDQVDFLEGCT
jgi:hypothetical protein